MDQQNNECDTGKIAVGRVYIIFKEQLPRPGKISKGKLRNRRKIKLINDFSEGN